MTRRTLLTALIVGLALTLLPPVAQADEDLSDDPGDLKPKVVSAFKNGYGFFVNEGVFNLEDGWAITDHVPDGTLGTVWLQAPDENATVAEAISYMAEVKEEIEAVSMTELLRANIGNRVKLTVRPESEVISGILKAVPGERDAANGLTTYAYSSYQPQFLLITTEEGDVALNMTDVERVGFPDNSQVHFQIDGEEKRMKIKVLTEEETARIRVSYLQSGISWVPSYSIDLADDAKAQITLKATLINDVEDLEDAEVHFVVGYPNFAYADTPSPMSLAQSLAQFINQLRSGRGLFSAAGTFANIMSQTTAYYAYDTETPVGNDGPEFGYGEITNLPGSSEQDLFLYRRDGVTLAEGERGYYPVLSDRVDYEHVYKWDVFNTEGDQQVWHYVRLTNSTDRPWTTAPALIANGWRPVAQDTLNYTPTGASTDVKLTAAIDIHAESEEIEISRKRDAFEYNWRDYDLVTLEGRLHITNYKPEDVTLEIVRRFDGETLETSHGAEVAKNGTRLSRVNPDSSVSWNLTLAPGEDVTLTYKYEKYV